MLNIAVFNKSLIKYCNVNVIYQKFPECSFFAYFNINDNKRKSIHIKLVTRDSIMYDEYSSLYM